MLLPSLGDPGAQSAETPEHCGATDTVFFSHNKAGRKLRNKHTQSIDFALVREIIPELSCGGDQTAFLASLIDCRRSAAKAIGDP